MGAPAPRYARPPWGDFDERVASIAAAQGYPLVGWDVVLDKALHGGDLTERVRALADRIRPGAIILAHDGRRPRASTSAALPTLLARLRERGFELVTVSEQMRAAHRRADAS